MITNVVHLPFSCSTTYVVETMRTGVSAMDHGVRLVVVTMLMAILMSLSERTTLDREGLRIVALSVPTATGAA